jgi:hypothetical protein
MNVPQNGFFCNRHFVEILVSLLIHLLTFKMKFELFFFNISKDYKDSLVYDPQNYPSFFFLIAVSIKDTHGISGLAIPFI